MAVGDKGGWRCLMLVESLKYSRRVCKHGGVGGQGMYKGEPQPDPRAVDGLQRSLQGGLGCRLL